MSVLLKELAVNTVREMRDPLTSIKGLLQLTAEKKAFVSTHFKVMFEEINKASRIIEDFLKVSNSPQLNYHPCNINFLVNGFLHMCQSTFDEQNIKVLKNLTAQKISAVIDHDRIYSVIINIIKNAVNAMPEGGILAVVTRPVDKMICIEFSHTEKGRSTTIRLYLPAS